MGHRQRRRAPTPEAIDAKMDAGGGHLTGRAGPYPWAKGLGLGCQPYAGQHSEGEAMPGALAEPVGPEHQARPLDAGGGTDADRSACQVGQQVGGHCQALAGTDG